MQSRLRASRKSHLQLRRLRCLTCEMKHNRSGIGRVGAFLPLLHGVGLGRVADTSLHRVTQKPAMLVMQLADGTLQAKKFEGRGTNDGGMGPRKHLGFAEFLGLHSWRPETFKCLVESMQ